MKNPTVTDVLEHLEKYNAGRYAEFERALRDNPFGTLGFNPESGLRNAAYLAALKTVQVRNQKLSREQLLDSLQLEVLRRSRFPPSSASPAADHMEILYTAALADIWAEIKEVRE